ADSGPGTLRAALEEDRPRRVGVSVAGEIFLRSPLVIRASDITIAGQTAPSPGISLLGDTLRVRANDVIIRNIRFRVGELPGPNASNRDGISIETGPDRVPVENVIVENCSIAWAVDESLT